MGRQRDRILSKLREGPNWKRWQADSHLSLLVFCQTNLILWNGKKREACQGKANGNMGFLERLRRPLLWWWLLGKEGTALRHPGDFTSLSPTVVGLRIPSSPWLGTLPEVTVAEIGWSQAFWAIFSLPCYLLILPFFLLFWEALQLPPASPA